MTDYNDNDWENITVPHTWNTVDGQDGGSNYMRTSYWYRRELDYVPVDRKKAYIEFLGSNQKTDLYINSKRVYLNKDTGEYTHKGGYTAFRYDVTEYLKNG